MQKQQATLIFIVLLLIGAITVITNLPLQLGLDLRGGAQLTIQVKTLENNQQIKPEDLNAVKKVIENRINSLGVAEPVIQTVGGNKILVQLPGVTNPQEAEKILGGTALLEFRSQKLDTQNQFSGEYRIKQALELQLAQLKKQGQTSQIEADIIKLQENILQSQANLSKLFEPPAITGKNLKDARPEAPQTNRLWSVAIRFDEEGGKKFADLTKSLAGTGRSIGIFLDNNLISAPNVDVQYAKAGITGGQATINGDFKVEQAQELAVQLRGGSLPFPVAVVENRTIGATLGQDSIKRSIYAAGAGLFLVLVFIGVYYRVPGLVANIALIIYSILTFAAFALIGVTMTLPGIAGFILSIGMAVDANVLIFERTREELRAGKSLYRSVESGFYRAFTSILDSNITTLIACAAMFWFGSGLVKGFAVTLSIGVIISMFTAVTCSRTLLFLLVLGVPKLRQRPELFCPNLPATVK